MQRLAAEDPSYKRVHTCASCTRVRVGKLLIAAAWNLWEAVVISVRTGGKGCELTDAAMAIERKASRLGVSNILPGPARESETRITMAHTD